MEPLLELIGNLIFDWLAGRGQRDPGRDPMAGMPNLRGLPVSVARRTLFDCDLCANLVRLTEHPATAEDVVVDQNPAPGARVYRRSAVTIYVRHRSAASGASPCTASKLIACRLTWAHTTSYAAW